MNIRSMYLAICYECNHNCVMCPQKLKKHPIIPESGDEIKNKIADAVRNNGINYLIVSGGEPFLHRELFDILQYAIKMGLFVNILTNGNMLANKEIFTQFVAATSPNQVQLTISVYSHIEELNDRIAGYKGSWKKTLKGILELQSCGYNIVIKHCLHGMNYLYLTDFLDWTNNQFSHDTTINICNIDYIGMRDTELQKCAVSLTKTGKALTHALSHNAKMQYKQRICCSEFPLCTVSHKYWKYLNRGENVKFYTDPQQKCKNVKLVHNDTSKSFPQCKNCILSDSCPGMWNATIEYWGRRGLPAVSISRKIGNLLVMQH